MTLKLLKSKRQKMNDLNQKTIDELQAQAVNFFTCAKFADAMGGRENGAAMFRESAAYLLTAANALQAQAVVPVAAQGEPVAYVLMHPTQGPLWANVISADRIDVATKPSYPLMPLYSAHKIRELVAQLDAARLDAGRLDWLDREIGCPLVLHDCRCINLSDLGLRHVIDAAMAQEKPA